MSDKQMYKFLRFIAILHIALISYILFTHFAVFEFPLQTAIGWFNAIVAWVVILIIGYKNDS